MRIKEQRVFEARWSLWMALLGHLVLLGEDIREEYGVKNMYFSENLVDPLYWTPGETIYLYLEARPKGLEEMIRDRIPPRLGRLEARSSDIPGVHLDDLYDLFYRGYTDYIIPLLQRRAPTTTRMRVEYYVAVAEKGEVVEVEGDVDRVRLPFFNAWASGHTHPAGHCMFSPKDLESARALFMTGGLATGVVTEGCMVTMWRKGVFTEEDLDALLDLQHDLRRLRRRVDLSRAIQRFQQKTRSLRLTAFLAGLPPR